VDSWVNNNRKLLKANCYSRLSSNDAVNTTLNRNKTMRQLNSVLGTYNRDNMVSHDSKSLTKRSKGNKTARSPRRKARAANKLLNIYKQLGERLKSMQVASQQIYQKAVKLKQYENRMKEELKIMEKATRPGGNASEREQALEIQRNRRNNEEFKEIIRNIRSIDTKPTDLFGNTDQFWKQSQAHQEHSLRDPFDPTESQSHLMLQPLGDDELAFTQSDNQMLKSGAQFVDAATSTAHRLDDKSTLAHVEQASVRLQAELISSEQVNKLETLSQDYQSFLQQKKSFEQTLRLKNHELAQKSKDIEQAQAMLKSKTVQYDDLSLKFKAQQSELAAVKEHKDQLYKQNEQYQQLEARRDSQHQTRMAELEAKLRDVTEREHKMARQQQEFEANRDSTL